MRYVYILIGVLMLSNLAHSEERIGLVHRPLFSPSGEHLAFLSERRYNQTREYTLSILTARREDSKGDFRIGYSLTPRIHDVTISPDQKIIAYLAHDIDYWFGIYFYFIDTGKAFGIEWSSQGSKIEKLQFSKDQRYIRYYSTPFTPNDGSLGNRINAAVVKTVNAKWIGMSIAGKPGYIFSKAEQAKMDWAPIEKPKEIPAFLTQSVPKIKKDTQMQWAPDSKSLYLVDETGLWRSDIGIPFIYQWTQIVKAPAIARFQLSPIGTHLLYEVTLEGKEEKAIWILRLKSELSDPSGAEPREIARGWDATFGPEGKTIFYSNLEAFTEIYLDGKKDRDWKLPAYHP